MSDKKSIKRKWQSLDRVSKIQLVSASALTVFLIIAIPVYAWFTVGDNYETLTKVEEPEGMNIRAGNDDPIVNFDLSGIDIEYIKENGSQGFVFGVKSGNYKTRYNLLLAHTTNIPLTYKIYTATKVEGTVDENNIPAGAVPYVKKVGGDETKTYYQKGTEITLEVKNAETDADKINTYGRTPALTSGTYYDSTYDASDNPELYAIPIYMQTADPITPTESNDIDYFILDLSWDTTATETEGFSQWNIAVNNKETDMIYITAHKYTD